MSNHPVDHEIGFTNTIKGSPTWHPLTPVQGGQYPNQLFKPWIHFAHFWTSNKWDQTRQTLLFCLVSFIRHYVCEIYLCHLGRCSSLISYYCIGFHCMCTVQFILLMLMNIWVISSFWWLKKQCYYNYSWDVFWCTYMHTSVGYIPKGESSGL